MGLIGNLLVKLNVDTKGFTTGLSQAATAADGFSKKLAGNFKQTSSSSKKTGDDINLFAKQTDKAFKDVKRIVQGIVLSQAFYKTINMIQQGTSAVIDFSMACEQAQSAFSIMFKDTDKGKRFMQMVEDFAADTPYKVGEAATNARKLLAYGFDPSVMRPLMDTLADAAAASGSEETFGRVAVAMGQIRTKGKLATQELLQLTEAGIPAFEILQEKLGLTKDQLANIGRQGIPASAAIQAILTGMQERYGGAARAMSETMKGMLSTISDNALIISKSAFEPMYNSAKGTIRKIRDLTDNMRTIVRQKGIGGLLESMLPPQTVATIRLFVANLKSLGTALANLWRAFGPIRQVLGELGMLITNFVLPAITLMVQAFAWFVQSISMSTPAVRVFISTIAGILIAGWVAGALMTLTTAIKSLFIVKAAAQLLLYLAKAIRVLSMAIISNPWVAALAVASGALLYFGMTSKTVKGWLGDLGSKITSAFGHDPSKQFAPKMEDNVAIADEFNESLGTSADKMDDMGDSAKEAGKKAKEALLSFDEVFTINDDQDEAGGIGDNAFDMGNMDVGAPSIPEIGLPDNLLPDATESIKSWVQNVTENLGGTLKNALIGMGIGGIIGGVIGGILGGPSGAFLGAKIGAVAGGIAGMFWDSLSVNMKNSVKVGGIGAAIGGVIGAIAGGPGGALIGAAIGGAVGAIGGYFWESIKAFFSNKSNQQGAIGAAIGSALGLVFGPVGAVVGGMIGQQLGQNWQGIVQWWTDTNAAVAQWKADTEAKFDAWWSGTISGFSNWYTESITSLENWFSETGAGISNWASESRDNLATWWTETKTGIGTWASETGSGIKTWLSETGSGIGTWASDTASKFSTWWSDSTSGFGTWWEDTKTGFSDWWSSLDSGTDIWSQDTLERFTNWASESGTKFSTWWTDTTKGFGDWVSGTGKKVTDWKENTKTSISSWATETGAKIGTWWSTSVTGFTTWVSETGSKIGTWVSNNKTNFQGWCSSTGEAFGTWWTNTKEGFNNWARDTYRSVFGWFDDMSYKLSQFFEKLAFWRKDAEKSPNIDYSSYNVGRTGSSSLSGHATGGVFNREHIARFAEGNKAEAIIPLENAGAMQPFVEAVASGLEASLITAVARMGVATTQAAPQVVDERPILYVGNLIADDRGLTELERRMQVIRMHEKGRRGE